MEYLPVCTPEDNEKEDARAFAASVRLIMAEALKIPVVNQRLEDAKVFIYYMHLKYLWLHGVPIGTHKDH